MKKIVIIGASSGMGYQMAADFAAAGCRVGIAARREQPLKTLKEQYPQNIEYLTLDVTSKDAVERFQNLIELIDGMDILIYASGCGWQNLELDATKDARTVAVNVGGFTTILTAAYKYFRDTANVSRGRIAAITSVAGAKGIGRSAVYSASKRYQWTFLQALDQLAHTQHVNVGITDIRPGFVNTELLGDHTPYPMEMSVAYAAKKIELAVLRGRRVAYIDSRWRIVADIMKLIPNPLWPHLSFRF